MAVARAPKQWSLTKSETVNSFESWKQNLQYTLALDQQFAPFLVDGVTWLKKTRGNPTRGFVNDGDGVAQANRKTAQQKVTMLELMLGQVANYCPVISRNQLVKNSISMDSIWQSVRSHFGFQSTGGHFVDLCDIKLEPGERSEDLYQRLVAFVDDNLLTTAGGITHHGDAITEDEELSPSLENFVVLTWLRLLHTDLPRLVKQRYGTDLRSRTLASIKPEISQAINTLLDEVQMSSDARVLKSTNQVDYSSRSSKTTNPRRTSRPRQKSCPMCKQAGRDSNHFLSRCTYLPEEDRKYLTKVRQIVASIDEDNNSDHEEISTESIPAINRMVQVKQSPYMNVYYGPHAIRVTLDTGAETNMIRSSLARDIQAPIKKSTQNAYQADGKSPLAVIGETHMIFTRDQMSFTFQALVVEDLDVDVLGGVPFTDCNDITIRTARHLVILSDGSEIRYGSNVFNSNPSIRRTQAHILRAPSTATLWPGDFVEVKVPDEESSEDVFALEPRTDNDCNSPWLKPSVINSVGGTLRVCNNTDEPILLKKNQHFGQVSSLYTPQHISKPIDEAPEPSTKHTVPFSTVVRIDPDLKLSSDITHKFRELLEKYDDVFDPQYHGYNGAAGPYEAVVNIGPVQPPQRKGRLPQYNKSKLVELQQKCDDLERLGVLRKPEDMDIVAEYLNPSFLVKKPSGSFRLVTAFAEVGRYTKPQPALMPDVDTILRQIAQWKYIVVSDLTSAFYQIPLSKKSMKYCGIVTPYRGVRVYTRTAMGMPGSETALEELMSRVLGDLLQEGVVSKLADDLYCGGNTPEQLMCNWERVLQAFAKCNLRLSATKTVIAPHSTMVLGWNWSQGTLRASPHRISALSSCSVPSTVRGLRSFIGAYKVLARVIPQCASIIGPLDGIVAGQVSTTSIKWTDEQLKLFQSAQMALSTNKVITLARPEDQLWIVTDGAVKNRGIGATLYVVREDKPSLAGFFSAKLRPRQVTWLPCEVEALGIAAAVKHFSAFIIQSHHPVSVLTDSKPCVQAYEKLCRGEFSSSHRVATFLATASRFQVSIRHISGSVNIPSDFSSRNALECDSPTCQICSFVAMTEDSVVRPVAVDNILSGEQRLPFTSRSAWMVTQQECTDLRRTHAHLSQGTRPSKKATTIRDVKRYLNVATIAKDGLLIVRREQNLAPCRECIIVPRQVLDGLLMALHLKLNHPSSHQLKCVTGRYFYALDMDQAISRIAENCHQCIALQSTPRLLQEQSSSDPPEAVGISFAADVLRRERQIILVVRETVTSYTKAQVIESEKRDCLKEALITLCMDLHPLDGPLSVVRTDAAPGFVALVDDIHLRKHHMCIEIGRVKNKNKNPVAEKAIQELEGEILRHDPTGGSVTQFQLSIILSSLNARIRSRGLSAREMMFQRDQFTNLQLPVSDRMLAIEQYEQRCLNHPHSERTKTPMKTHPTSHNILVGDLVYLYCDQNKFKGRDRYLVVSVDGIWCSIRKFVGIQLRSTSYRVKLSECYKIKQDSSLAYQPEYEDNPSDDNPLDTSSPIVPEETMESYESDTSTPIVPEETVPPTPPDIPLVISDPDNMANPDPIVTDESEHTESMMSNQHDQRPKRSHQIPRHLKDYVLK